MSQPYRKESGKFVRLFVVVAILFNLMDFFNKKLQKEIDLIKKAEESEIGQIEILNYLKPLVFSVGNDLINIFEKENNLVFNDRKIILQNGWKHLDFAIKKYTEKLESMEMHKEAIFTFSEYFTWFIKQGILEYLNSKQKFVENNH